MTDAINEAEIRRIFEQAPFITAMGMEMVRAGRGECESLLVLRPDHRQQDGFVHAGVQATMADHTAGAAAATLIAAGELVLTAEFKINLLRAAKGERLRCVAAVLKPGRALTVVESEVYCGDEAAERLVAKATVTLAVVGRNRSQGES